MRKIWNDQHGMAVWEIMASVLIVVVACVLWIGVGIMGNFWYTEEGVIKKIRLQYPEITQIIDTERNIFTYSVITVKEGEAAKKYYVKKYYLDTDILFNYELRKADK